MAERVVRFDAVSFSYSEAKTLDVVSFCLYRGECVALVGPNGSGKTTTLKLLLGLEHPGAGSIELLGSKGAVKRDSLGYVPQYMVFDRNFPITVQDVVKMGLLKPASRTVSSQDKAAVEHALAQVNLVDLSHRTYSTLSGGQRRRVLLARALVSAPAVLVLDEPTANMDSDSEQRLYNILQGLKGTATILIVTHDTGFVAGLADRVLSLNKGCLHE
jgi:zinc transport system ATP-binding protein